MTNISTLAEILNSVAAAFFITEWLSLRTDEGKSEQIWKRIHYNVLIIWIVSNVIVYERSALQRVLSLILSLHVALRVGVTTALATISIYAAAIFIYDHKFSVKTTSCMAGILYLGSLLFLYIPSYNNPLLWKILLVTCCFGSTLYLDVSYKVGFLHYKQFARALFEAIQYCVLALPLLVLLCSTCCLVVIVFCEKIYGANVQNSALLNAFVYYCTIYLPFYSIYWKCKKICIENYRRKSLLPLSR